MSLYKINPDYSLILKNDNQLIIIINKKFKIYQVPENEVISTKKIMQSEIFEKQNTKTFKMLLIKRIVIKCTNTSANRNTQSYLEGYTSSKINISCLNDKNVFIIGLGGIGCEIITHLVGSGVKKYTILDFDTVDDTNLNRQYLYTRKDISKNKVDLISKKIKEKEPSIMVSKYNKFINSSNDVEKIIKKENIDMVICAADTPFLDIRMSVLEACAKTKTACIFGGLNIITGQYGPTLINPKKMNNYYRELEKIKKVVSCNSINKASFGPTNTIVSAYMSIDIIMTLLGKKKYINSLNRIKTINFITRKDYEEKKF